MQNLSKEDLIKLLGKAISYSQGTKFQRFAKLPLKLPYAKFLELITKQLGAALKIKTKTFWGEDINVIVPEGVSLSIYRYGFYEEDLTRILLECLKPGMVFFDIGAHFGYFTLLAALLAGDSGSVHSFEPTPSSFDILKSNTLNKKNIVLNNKAVFSRKTSIYINDYGVQYSSFNSTYEARLPIVAKLKLTPKKYEAEAISIDEYVETAKISPNFIKIDAESAEYEILNGMKKTIEAFHPIISVEVGDLGVSGVATSKDLVNFLIQTGYVPYEYRNGSFSQHCVKAGQYSYGNIIFFPETVEKI